VFFAPRLSGCLSEGFFDCLTSLAGFLSVLVGFAALFGLPALAEGLVSFFVGFDTGFASAFGFAAG